MANAVNDDRWGFQGDDTLPFGCRINACLKNKDKMVGTAEKAKFLHPSTEVPFAAFGDLRGQSIARASEPNPSAADLRYRPGRKIA